MRSVILGRMPGRMFVVYRMTKREAEREVNREAEETTGRNKKVYIKHLNNRTTHPYRI